MNSEFTILKQVKSQKEWRKERKKKGGREEKKGKWLSGCSRVLFLLSPKNRLSIYITSHFRSQKNERRRVLWVSSWVGPIFPLTCWGIVLFLTQRRDLTPQIPLYHLAFHCRFSWPRPRSNLRQLGVRDQMSSWPKAGWLQMFGKERLVAGMFVT